MAGERVLVVDDNPFNVKLAKHLLAGDGFGVCTAGGADEALAALASFRPHLVLMDLQLPGTDGLTLARRFRSDPANDTMVIVASSADASPADQQRVLDAGCDGYIAKPINVDDFCATVRKYLGSRPTE